MGNIVSLYEQINCQTDFLNELRTTSEVLYIYVVSLKFVDFILLFIVILLSTVVSK